MYNQVNGPLWDTGNLWLFYVFFFFLHKDKYKSIYSMNMNMNTNQHNRKQIQVNKSFWIMWLKLVIILHLMRLSLSMGITIASYGWLDRQIVMVKGHVANARCCAQKRAKEYKKIFAYKPNNAQGRVSLVYEKTPCAGSFFRQNLNNKI